MRTFVGAGSLTVNLYGTPQNRRVETDTAPLEVEGKVPWKRIDDPTMFKGEKVVEQYGAPPRSTSVTRRVYAPGREAHVRLDLELVLRRRADRRPARDEAAAEGAREAGGGPQEATPKAKTPVLPRASATTR